MPFIRSFVSKRRARVVALILSLGEIMPTYSRYVLKGLTYITIIILFSRQPSSYIECINLNMRSLCDVRLVFTNKYLFFARPTTL